VRAARPEPRDAAAPPLGDPATDGPGPRMAALPVQPQPADPRDRCSPGAVQQRLGQPGDRDRCGDHVDPGRHRGLDRRAHVQPRERLIVRSSSFHTTPVLWGAPASFSMGPSAPYNPGMPDRPIKVLIAKPGLDGHDRGAKVLARGLRDEGFEVVYTGLRQTPEMVVSAALQEDVDVVGLSILSGAHMTLVPRITALMRDRGLDDILVTVGGIIPDDDIGPLRDAGVARVFGPGTTIGEVATFLRENARSRDQG